MNSMDNIYPSLSTTSSTSQGIKRISTPHGEAVQLADEVPVEQSHNKITQDINASKEIDWKVKSSQALCFFASVALGVLTALAISGLMVNPVGWAIAGGLLLVGVVGLIAFGGPKGFVEALKLSLSGFTIGFGGTFAGLAAGGVVIGVGDAIAAVSQSFIGAVFAGIGGFLLTQKVNLSGGV